MQTAGLAFLAVLILALVSGCATERTVAPQPVKHRLYFGGGQMGGDDLIVVEVKGDTARQVIDTVSDFGWVGDMLVSPDGRWLYATRQLRHQPWELVKLNTVTLVVEGTLQEGDGPVWSEPYWLRSLVLVDDGRTIVWSNRGGLWIVDTESFTVREIREQEMLGMRWLEGTSLIAGAGPTVYDVDRDLVVASGIPVNEGPEFRVRQALLHPDGEHLYCIAYREDPASTATPDIFLSVVNIPEWKTVAERDIGADLAGFAFGPRGYPVFVAECCTKYHVLLPQIDTLGGWIDLLAPTTLAHLGAVSAGRGVYWLDRSPDGHLMYATDWVGRGSVLALDAGSGEILSSFARPQYSEPGFMAVGPAPE